MKGQSLTRGRGAWRAGPLYACVAALALTMSGPPLHGGVRPAGPDVAVTDDSLFVADPHGRVLQGPIRAGRIPIGQLVPVAAASGVKYPIALDARGTRLVVIDRDGPTVVDIDLRAGTAKVMLRGSPLREPSGIAIAASGTVAVSDPGARAVFLLSDGKEMQIDRRLTVPLQVEFDPSEDALYVYDGERGLLRVEYSSVENFMRMRSAERIAVTPLTGTTRVLSFAPRRGLLYVAEESGLRVAVPAKRTSLSVPQQFYRRRFTSIAVDTQFLAGIDDAGASVEIIDRPVPVSVNLDPEDGDPNAGMLALLDYLASRRLLAARGVALDQPNEPYDRVLARYKVLVPTSPDPGGSPLDKARLQSLFCSLNARRCGGAAGPDGDDEIAIPQLTVESYLAVSKKPLGGKTVERHIEDNVLDPSQRAAVTADYLAKINLSDGTLESELQRRKLVMAVPMSGALSPGTVIRVTGINETPTGDLASRCGVAVERETSPTYLPETIVTRTIAALPDAVRAEAAAAAVSEVELGFDRVVRETIAAPSRECRVKDRGEKEYLVTESVKVDSLRYRMRAGEPSSARARGALQAKSVRAPAWKVVQGPFVVAYKAVELSSVALGLAERSEDPARIKPGLVDGSAFLRRSEGDVNLPETHWRFDVLVPAPDYLTSSSPLWDLRRANPGLGLSSHERVLAAARSVVLRRLKERLTDVKVTLSDARRNLSKTISYSDELAAGTEDFYVAVGEADDDVNQDHPGFIHGGRSAWFESSPDGLIRRRVSPPAGAPGEAAVHRLTSADHGTHVAGIIAARSSSLMPGLTPSVRLYLVDTAKNLTDTIQDAYDSDLRIFNFSFAIEAGQDIDAMKNRMIQHWSDALFVVAAGNEGLDLNAGGSQPLIGWVLEAPNIIGVGAARTDGSDVMGVQPDPSDATGTVPGSNFGSRFVQLIAPGEEIYSLGDQQYAFATGTSQAVPQVTAAAAILSARMVRSTGVKIKARLIATAHWTAAYKGKVWGGLLDVDRAVMHLTRNVLRIQSAPQSVRAVMLDDDVMLTIKSATTYPSDGTAGDFITMRRIPLRRVLRLQHLGASNFRIVTINSTDHLEILFGRVEGRIPCTEMNEYDATAARFVPLPAGTPDLCESGGVPIMQLQDYVAKAAAIPERVKF